jgi:hypothetical protein
MALPDQIDGGLEDARGIQGFDFHSLPPSTPEITTGRSTKAFGPE